MGVNYPLDWRSRAVEATHPLLSSLCKYPSLAWQCRAVLRRKGAATEQAASSHLEAMLTLIFVFVLSHSYELNMLA